MFFWRIFKRIILEVKKLSVDEWIILRRGCLVFRVYSKQTPQERCKTLCALWAKQLGMNFRPPTTTTTTLLKKKKNPNDMFISPILKVAIYLYRSSLPIIFYNPVIVKIFWRVIHIMKLFKTLKCSILKPNFASNLDFSVVHFNFGYPTRSALMQ